MDFLFVKLNASILKWLHKNMPVSMVLLYMIKFFVTLVHQITLLKYGIYLIQKVS